MTFDQTIVFSVLAAAMVLFVWGRWRFDVVAVAALVACVVAGVVPMDQAFAGFGHPAIVVVAVVLAVTRAFVQSGLVELVGGALMGAFKAPFARRMALVAVAAVLSMFMNNVGALALMMPVALQVAREGGEPPSRLLMPIAFGSILGGLVTLIGTPPNIIVAGYRGDLTGEPFGMFAFAPIGLPIVLVGLAYLLTVGLRLLPKRSGGDSGKPLFDVNDYVVELKVPRESPAVGQTVAAFERSLKSEAHIFGLIKGGKGAISRGRRHHIRAGDILMMEVDPGDLPELTEEDKLKLLVDPKALKEQLEAEEIVHVEAVVMPGGRLAGWSANGFGLDRLYDIDLLAVAREGQPVRRRIQSVPLRPGDVLLVQGDAESIHENLQHVGCLPLAERGLRLAGSSIWLPPVLFAGAIALAATGVLSVPVALLAALLLMILGKALSPRDVYDAIDWPVIVRLGAMIPVGGALEQTGATTLIADGILGLAGDLPAWAILTVVLVAAMTLSDVMNNAATAVVMAPIAAGIAERMEVNADPFLMAVAIGASCAFLTPIGHQNNTLIMGPGGYRFGDYWRMGLPLELMIVAVAIPMLLIVWPL
ncbi:MAG: SLC13 family permease [Inquilinus sp.]|nr:SLC13 family permease [Inquilinus sp.]